MQTDDWSAPVLFIIMLILLVVYTRWVVVEEQAACPVDTVYVSLDTITIEQLERFNLEFEGLHLTKR